MHKRESELLVESLQARKVELLCVLSEKMQYKQLYAEGVFQEGFAKFVPRSIYVQLSVIP